MTLPLAIILLFFAFAVTVGVLARRRAAGGLEQWALGNRGFGSLWMFILLNGENSTTFTFLGASGWAYGKGVAAGFVLGYGCLAYIAGYWMMPRVWRYAKEHRLVSFADYFAKKYDSAALGIVVSVVALLGMTSLLATQLRGLTVIISEASYGALPAWASVVLGTTAMVSYILISGIRGSVTISVFKDVLIVAVALFLGLYLPFHYFGGVRPMFAAIAATRPEFFHLAQPGAGPAWYTSTVLLVSLGYYMYPHTFTALYAARSGRVVRRNNALMPLAQFIILLMFFIGFSAILVIPELKGANGDLALLRIVKQTFPSWLVGIVGGVGVLMAIVPGSMILLNAATIVAANLYRGALFPAATEQQTGRVARIALPIFAVAVAGFVLAKNIPFVGLIVLAASVLTQLFPAFIFSVFPWRLGDKRGALAGITVGGAIVAWFTFSAKRWRRRRRSCRGRCRILTSACSRWPPTRSCLLAWRLSPVEWASNRSSTERRGKRAPFLFLRPGFLRRGGSKNVCGDHLRCCESWVPFSVMMILQGQVEALRGAKVRVTTGGKESAAMSGILRVVAHEFPSKGQTLNLEVASPNGKMVTIQLTGPEAKLLAKAEGEREFRWNGKPRPLRPVSADDMIPIEPETHVLSFN